MAPKHSTNLSIDQLKVLLEWQELHSLEEKAPIVFLLEKLFYLKSSLGINPLVWPKNFNVERLNQQLSQTYFTRVDTHIHAITNIGVIASVPVNEFTVQPQRKLHGGVSAALAEGIGSFATNCLINSQTHYAVGTELYASHLGSATEGRAYAVCSPIKLGRTLHHWSVDIFNEQTQILTHAKHTVMILEK